MHGRWGRYGWLAITGALVAAPACGAQPVTPRNNQPATHQQRRADHSPKSHPSAPLPPIVVQVQPTAEEVQAIAEQEAAKRRILGLEPDAWVAIFTAILSLSTGLLWLATRKSANAALIAAEAAKTSAEALPNVERAHVFFRDVRYKMGVLPQQTGDAAEFEFEAVFQNLGKTPAIIRECRCGIVAADGIPAFGVFRTLKVQALRDRAIGAGSPYTHTFKGEIRGDWKPRPVSMPAAPNIYAVGYLMYEDIFEDKHEVGFCWSLSWEAVVLEEASGAEALNYRRMFKERN